MTVYYVATTECPSSAKGVRFYTDALQAKNDADENRQSVYQFQVNTKCNEADFDHETIMVFKHDPETGDLKFMASGLWVEVHEILGIPFYKDFEFHSKSLVAMSLRYFNENYSVVSNNDKKKQSKQKPVEQNVPVEEPEIEAVVDELFGAPDGANTGFNNFNDDLAKMIFGGS